jgi:hypothetical protein
MVAVGAVVQELAVGTRYSSEQLLAWKYATSKAVTLQSARHAVRWAYRQRRPENGSRWSTGEFKQVMAGHWAYDDSLAQQWRRRHGKMPETAKLNAQGLY